MPKLIINPDIDVARISKDFHAYEESKDFPADGDPATVYRRGFLDGVRYARSLPMVGRTLCEMPDGSAESAAAELRKTCATCSYFTVEHDVAGMCVAWPESPVVPVNGSGFCHQWKAKP